MKLLTASAPGRSSIAATIWRADSAVTVDALNRVDIAPQRTPAGGRRARRRHQRCRLYPHYARRRRADTAVAPGARFELRASMAELPSAIIYRDCTTIQ